MNELTIAEPTIGAVAAATARKYRGYAERDDVAQELRVWLLDTSFPNRLEWLADMNDTDPEERAVFVKKANRLRSRLSEVADRYARAERAASCGFRPEDEHFYTRRTLAGLVAQYLNGGSAFASTAGGERVSGTSDPAESGNTVAMLADIDRVWEKLAAHHQLVLVARAGCDTLEECAERLTVEGEPVPVASTVWRWEQRALGALIDLLGGPSPYTQADLVLSA